MNPSDFGVNLGIVYPVVRRSLKLPEIYINPRIRVRIKVKVWVRAMVGVSVSVGVYTRLKLFKERRNDGGIILKLNCHL